MSSLRQARGAPSLDRRADQPVAAGRQREARLVGRDALRAVVVDRDGLPSAAQGQHGGQQQRSHAQTVATRPTVAQPEQTSAWLSGYRSGLVSGLSAVHYVTEADRLLELCRVSRADRRVIWQQAEDDARSDHPDLPALIVRALAARRITALLCERVSAHIEAE